MNSEGGLMNLGKMCSQLEEGLKLLACEFIEMILEELNEELRRSKNVRKDLGLYMQAHDKRCDKGKAKLGYI